ncbi:MAG TPA: cobalamin B12-binding domain-containing protein, partial [Polyangia bacterium]|nr:cobalamin B12-binding domain-containing protein [Polyangia bacterium]
MSGTMRGNVVLYNPRCVFWTMPLSLVAIGSALDRARHDVAIVDGRLESDPIAALLARIDAGTVCVGITVLTGAPIRDALEATRAVRAAHPQLPIVWGGWHPSLFPAECL